MSKETFKMFVRSNPKLIDYVTSKEKTWQEFYEMFEIYGENNSIWNTYLYGNGSSNNTIIPSKKVGETKLNDIFNMIKGMDLDSIKKGVEGLQKAVGMIQEFGIGKSSNNQYQPKPLYQHLDD